MAWFSLMTASRRPSKTILAETETAERTVIVQKEGRIMPLDHDCVDGRPEKVEKHHIGEDRYIGPLIVVRGTQKYDLDRRQQSSVLPLDIRKSHSLDFLPALAFACLPRRLGDSGQVL